MAKGQPSVKHLKALAVSAKNKRSYKQRGVQPALLERFSCPTGPNGQASKNLVIDIVVAEFTSLCPLTGQPDFATIRIKYRPSSWCVESKSLKLYMGSYRNQGEFHESCVQRMLRDLVKLLDPKYMRITGEFTPRGGIPFWPTAEYEAPNWSEESVS